MSKNLQYPIGGEFWFKHDLQDKGIYNNVENEGLLLSGGESAIRFILNTILFKNEEILLLPCYLCPKIVDLINELNIKYEFYNVDENLDIDIESIEILIKNHNVKAVFFIDYFGFYQKKIILDYLESLKLKDILIIEDAVQKFWIKDNNNFIGDYVFNSYRKFLPIDGSLVICKERLNSLKTLNKSSIYTEANDEYFKLMEKARIVKSQFILKGIGEEKQYLNLFSKANKEYYSRKQIYKINTKYKDYLNHLFVNLVIKKRILNYKYLLKNLKNINEITFLNKKDLENNMPLALPILIKNRDNIRMDLMKEKIYAPIHWNLKNEYWINSFKSSLNISENILSLPIDWRYEIEDMEFLVDKLKEILSRYKQKPPKFTGE